MRKQRKNRPDVDTCQQIADEYLSGIGCPELAKKYDYSAVSIAAIVRSTGAKIRSRADNNRLQAAIIDLTVLKSLIAERLSTTEIANLLGVTQPTIEMKMRREGLRSLHGRGSKMEKNYFWAGGETKTDDGYLYVKSPGHPFATKAGYVLQHRLVMEEVLGRYLDPKEVVHHKDCNRLNNDPSNLQVFQTNADHLRHELTGQTPNYTPEGLQRMRENALRLNHRRYGSSLAELETGADSSPLPTDRPPMSPDTNHQHP